MRRPAISIDDGPEVKINRLDVETEVSIDEDYMSKQMNGSDSMDDRAIHLFHRITQSKHPLHAYQELTSDELAAIFGARFTQQVHRRHLDMLDRLQCLHRDLRTQKEPGTWLATLASYMDNAGSELIEHVLLASFESHQAVN